MPATTAPHSNVKEGVKPNRLAGESSPYLLQHAYNPVDWHPWGEVAFALARARDKPIFLSIGYSTCYWCHVMERECFENPEIASVMNDLFVCIKVDREQRPDIDDMYMTAVQIQWRSGGWPMSVFLEPTTLKPFYTGTYFPPEDKFGRPGFPSVLRQIAAAWKNNRATVLEQADAIAEAVIQQHQIESAPSTVDESAVNEAVSALMASYDKEDGGFGGGPGRAPKFPTPVNLELLMGAAWDQKPVREAVLHTLERMAIGGMNDQVGGGFHRYSVDADWLVPHFEKMLYDNAQLASAYAQAFERTNDPFHALVLRRTLEYVLREMTSPEGGFYSAQDAEVNAMEGGNYLWTQQEIRNALKAAGLDADVDFALEVYGLNGGTNFQDPHHPEHPPSNVLFLADWPDEIARARGQPPDAFKKTLDRVNGALYAAREKRTQPSLDDKVLAGWNGLMIAGLADGGRVLREQAFVQAAEKAANFVRSEMSSPDGGLMRSWRNGTAEIEAFMEDYAFVAHGFLALHRATNNQAWLQHASGVMHAARQRFWDEQSGAYFDTQAGQSDLFVRIKSAYDGAVPSGNSMMLLNLLDLHSQTGEAHWLADAQKAAAALGGTLERHPAGAALAMLAIHRLQSAASAKTHVAASPATRPAKPSSSALSGSTSQKIEASLAPTEFTLQRTHPAKGVLTLKIARGWHINSNAPGDEFVVPLRIELTGCEGMKFTPEFPAAKSLTTEASAGALQVYEGEVEISFTLEQTGPFSGRPQIAIIYQACNDRVCLEPARMTLGLRIIAEK